MSVASPFSSELPARDSMGNQRAMHSAKPPIVTPADPREELRRLRAVSNGRAVLALAADFLIVSLAIAVAVSAQSAIVTICAMIVIAGRQVALLNLVHAAAHYSLFR